MSFRVPIVVACLMSWSCQLALAGGDFAIKTQIFSEDDDRPVSENLTIFHGQMIYDFGLTPPRTVTVFDTKSRKFVLAQQGRRVQTTLSADELMHFAATERAHAMGAANELVRFAANPKFVEEIDVPAGRLSLTSPVWDYHVDVRREDDRELLRRYGEFANWFTYLNGLLRPLPPAVRLELNRVLDKHKCLPERVVVQIKRDGKVVVEQRSHHQLIRKLGQNELDQVKVWNTAQEAYQTVDFSTYRSATIPKTKPKRR